MCDCELSFSRDVLARPCGCVLSMCDYDLSLSRDACITPCGCRLLTVIFKDDNMNLDLSEFAYT
jgi:hypothetical protein